MKLATWKLLLLSATITVSGAASAQSDWPAKPVRIVVPFAAGGTTDITGRVIADELTKAMKQSFIVDNKGGAGGNVGAKDFAPVSFVVRVPNVLVVNPALGAKSLAELIAIAKKKPGTLSYGSPGNGTTGHLSTELFKNRAGIFVTHIPYRGSGPMLLDLMSGQTQMAIDNLPSAMPHIKAGKLVALGVTGIQANAQLPDVPPIASILPGYAAESWFVLMAPAGTPPAIVNRLSAEVDKILKKPEVIERFKGLGAEPVGGTPEQLGKFINAETTKWSQVVKASGAKID